MIEVITLENQFDGYHLIVDGKKFTSPQVTIGRVGGVNADGEYRLQIDQGESSLSSSSLVQRKLKEFSLSIAQITFKSGSDFSHNFSCIVNLFRKDHEITLQPNREMSDWNYPWSFLDYIEKISTLAIEYGFSSSMELSEVNHFNLIKNKNKYVLIRLKYGWSPYEFLHTELFKALSEFSLIHDKTLSQLNLEHDYTQSSNTTEAKYSFLRLYIPAGKYQSEQIEAFVRLFESYLNQVENCAVQVDTFTSKKGKYFVFRLADKEKNNEFDLPVFVTRFDTFMILCKNDPAGAIRRISSWGITVTKATSIVVKYVKKYTRLMLDTQQEFELEVMATRHLRQHEIAELELGAMTVGTSTPPSTTTLILPAIINQPTGEGQPENPFTVYEQEALREIHEKARNQTESISLQSDFQALNDETAEISVRQSAWHKLFIFAKGHSKGLTQILSNSLVEYLMGKAEGKSY